MACKSILDSFKRTSNNREIATSYTSPVAYTDIDDEALDFCFDEAEKMLLSTRTAIDSLNQRAQTYINFCSLGISAIFAYVSLGLENQVFETDYAIMAAFACAASLLFSAAFCIMTIKLAGIAFLGSEPSHLLRNEYLTNISENTSQKKVVKFVTTQGYQDLIEHNKKVVAIKASYIRKAYWLIFTGLATFLAFILFVMLSSFF